MDLDKTPKTPQGYYLPNENDDDWKPAWDENFKKVGTDVSEIASRNVDFADSLKKISTEMEATAKELTERLTGKDFIITLNYGSTPGWFKIARVTIGSYQYRSLLYKGRISSASGSSVSHFFYSDFLINIKRQINTITFVFNYWANCHSSLMAYNKVNDDTFDLYIQLRNSPNQILLSLDTIEGDYKTPEFFNVFSSVGNEDLPSGSIEFSPVQSPQTNLIPYLANTCNLGSSTLPWENIYTHTSPIVGSGREIKEDIREIDEQYIKFLMSLNPVVYKFKDDENHQYLRMHAGFIAQEVEQALYDSGLNTLDFAGYIDSPETQQVQAVDNTGNPIFDETEQSDENGQTIRVKIPRMKTVIIGSKRGLRLEEFIAPIVAVIKNQQNQIEELRSQISAL